MLNSKTNVPASPNVGINFFCNFTSVSLLSIAGSASSIALTNFDFLSLELNELKFVFAKLCIAPDTIVFISLSDLTVTLGLYLTFVETSTNKNTGSKTFGLIDTGDLKDKKSSISAFLVFGIPSAFLRSTLTITLPNSGGSNSSPPKTFNDSMSLNSCFSSVL